MFNINLLFIASVLAFRDVELWGFGIYFWQVVCSIILLSAVFIRSPGVKFDKLSAIFGISLVWFSLWDFISCFILFDSIPALVSNYVQFDLLFALSVILYINNNVVDKGRALYKIAAVYLVFCIGYGFFESIAGAGDINVFHRSLGQPDRIRMLATEQSNVFPMFLIMLYIIYVMTTSVVKRVTIIICYFCAQVMVISKGALLAMLLTMLYAVIKIRSMSIKFITMIIAIIATVIVLNSEAMIEGFVKPVYESLVNFPDSMLILDNQRLTDSFVTRAITDLHVIYNYEYFGLGMGTINVPAVITNSLLSKGHVNTELNDYITTTPELVTPKDTFFMIFAAYGLLGLIIYIYTFVFVFSKSVDTVGKLVLFFTFVSSFFTLGGLIVVGLAMVYMRNVFMGQNDS